VIGEAIAAIRDGLVVGLPTDTVYGIGADPFDFEAVGRLFDLKGRPEGKPVGLLVASIDQAVEIGDMGEYATDLARRHWPGALTLIVSLRVVTADWVGDRQRHTIGLRVPDHPGALDLLRGAGPLAVTSANVSGGAETMDAAAARMIFGDGVAVYLEGVAPGGQASTVVDVTGVKPVVIREGPVSL
jgi:tRNA threonylcarbamoyl adenosine modification protein (Sua5/YciO/YrdC/YwlC family)